MATETSKGGRPPLPEDERLSKIVKVRFTPEEKATIQKAVELMPGVESVSEFIREAIMDVANAVVQEDEKAVRLAIETTATSLYSATSHAPDEEGIETMKFRVYEVVSGSDEVKSVED